MCAPQSTNRFYVSYVILCCRYVHFCGPKGELPKGVDGSYGTALTLGHALDPSMDVLIAYKQNGQFLHPDHGFPCRMLIPGWIGGRSVKWLSHLHVSDKDSQNWYHFHDNKVRNSTKYIYRACCTV